MGEYVKDASIFAQHIIIALDCLEEARAMQSIFSQEKYKSQYKIAPHFYLTAYHAMLFRFEIEVAKLFDTNAYNFSRFKNNVYSTQEIKLSDCKRYSSQVQIADKDLKSIRNRRNKVLAHSDKVYFNNPQELFNDEPVNFEVIKSLLLTMLEICNLVILNSTEYGPAHLYSTYNGDDFVKLFGYTTQSEKETEEFFSLLK